MMIAGGVEAAIHEASVGGFCSMKALSTRNDDPAGASRPFDAGPRRVRHRRGRRRAHPRGARARRGPRRRAARRARRLRGDRRRHPHHPARPGRDRRRPGRPPRAREGRHRGRPRSTTSTPMRPPRPRATRPSSRPSGRSSATAAGEGRGDRQQVDARPHPRCGRRDRGDRDDPGDPDRHRSRRRSTSSDPDPEAAGLDLTPLRAARREVRTALSNSFGFGGQNTALVFTPVRRMTDEQAVPDARAGRARREPTEPIGEPDRPGGRRRRRPGHRDSTPAAATDRSWRSSTVSPACSSGATSPSSRSRSGGTGLVLRKAAAIAAVPLAAGRPAAPAALGPEPVAGAGRRPPVRPSVKAPLTGIFYAAPGPGSAPYVRVGGEVASARSSG